MKLRDSVASSGTLVSKAAATVRLEATLLKNDHRLFSAFYIFPLIID
jgi:hypothetical protein